jgi:hypothetical protein
VGPDFTVGAPFVGAPGTPATNATRTNLWMLHCTGRAFSAIHADVGVPLCFCVRRTLAFGRTADGTGLPDQLPS